MKLAGSLFLAAVLAPVAPAPVPVNTARVFLHIQTTYGPLEIWTSGEDWCYARPDGTNAAWIGPLPVSTLDTSGQQDATAGTSFCAEHIAHGGPYGAFTAKITKAVEVEVTKPTLSEAVAEAHSQIVAALDGGWHVVPCSSN